MNKLLTTIGITLLIISVILATPLKDYFPVDFWQSLAGLFGGGNGDKNAYYKAMPATDVQNNIHIYVLIVLGITSIGLGKIYKPKGENE